MDQNTILETIKEKGVTIVKLLVTDVRGRLLAVGTPVSHLMESLEEGAKVEGAEPFLRDAGIDGSSIDGFARIEESDLRARPDPNTFRVLPWKVDGLGIALFFCDVLNPDGTPYEGDPRYVLKRTLERYQREKGYTFYLGPELEYFYSGNSERFIPLDKGGYFEWVPDALGLNNSTPNVSGDKLRINTVKALQEIGIEVEYEHHEVAISQHEIDLKYRDALTMADQVGLYRAIVKMVAAQNGVYATFMPKPVFGINGSGMHAHQSVFSEEKNLFFDLNASHHLSEMARKYLAGLMKHTEDFLLVVCPLENSYKRIVPGYEAPAYKSWGTRNRSALVRVPEYRPGKEKVTRLEYRVPDPSCNPYLAFALMIEAGMIGVAGSEKEYTPPPPVEKDIFHLTEAERKELGITTLPGSLAEALEFFRKATWVKAVLGEHTFQKVIDNAEMEWDHFRTQVTDVEIKRYFSTI